MKKVLGLLIIIILVIFNNSFSQDVWVNCTINTSNPEAVIYIDEFYAGKGSISLQLSPGLHEILIKKSLYAWNSEIISDKLLVKDTEIVKYYVFKEEIHLKTDPEDVYVFSKNDLVGHTPLWISPKIKELELRRPNYKSLPLKLDEVKNQIPIKLDFEGVREKYSFRNSPWFNVIIGTAIVIGGTAAYYKIQADKKYDEYLETNDQSLLDDTNRFDKYSGIAFGVLQVNFGFILYYLLFD